LGNVFFEFAGVNYNAMLVQISTPRNIGKVSGSHQISEMPDVEHIETPIGQHDLSAMLPQVSDLSDE